MESRYDDFIDAMQSIEDCDQDLARRQALERAAWDLAREAWREDPDFMRFFEIVRERFCDDPTMNTIVLLHKALEAGHVRCDDLVPKFGKYLVRCAEVLMRGDKDLPQYYADLEANYRALKIKALEMANLVEKGDTEALAEAREYLAPILRKEKGNVFFCECLAVFEEGGEG